jgi:hypothetical protein
MAEKGLVRIALQLRDDLSSDFGEIRGEIFLAPGTFYLSSGDYCIQKIRYLPQGQPLETSCSLWHGNCD